MDASFRSPVRNGTADLHSENMLLNSVELCESLPASKEVKREILHAELRWVQIELKREYQLGPSSSRKAGLHRVNRAIPPGGGITRFVFYESKLVRVR